MEFNSVFFAGGIACVDFVNTFDHRQTPPAYDFFRDPGDILRWGKAAGILPAGTAAKAASSFRGAPGLIALRTRVFRILWPLAHGKSPSQPALDAFNADWRKLAVRRRIVAGKGSFTLQQAEASNPIDRIADRVVSTMEDLLISIRPLRLRECEGCGWLYLDTSRNGMRRWCTMKICGNRAKARRHYERARR
jgi:predicted RNA-binding Zn ribbon-like protein